MHTSDLANEWSLLQKQFDSYEKHALLIKLMAIALLALATLLNTLNILIVLLLLVLWVQDAIWKTFQSRIEIRLLRLEKQLLSQESAATIGAYQFNSEYLKNRPGSLGLVKEYLQQAIKPTVAFPHIILLLIIGYQMIFLSIS